MYKNQHISPKRPIINNWRLCSLLSLYCECYFICLVQVHQRVQCLPVWLLHSSSSQPCDNTCSINFSCASCLENCQSNLESALYKHALSCKIPETSCKSKPSCKFDSPATGCILYLFSVKHKKKSCFMCVCMILIMQLPNVTPHYSVYWLTSSVPRSRMACGYNTLSHGDTHVLLTVKKQLHFYDMNTPSCNINVTTRVLYSHCLTAAPLPNEQENVKSVENFHRAQVSNIVLAKWSPHFTVKFTTYKAEALPHYWIKLLTLKW